MISSCPSFTAMLFHFGFDLFMGRGFGNGLGMGIGAGNGFGAGKEAEIGSVNDFDYSSFGDGSGPRGLSLHNFP